MKNYIIMGLAAVIVLLLVGSFIPVEDFSDGDDTAQTQSLTIQVRAEGSDEIHELTMDVPQKISLTQKIFSDLGIMSLSSNSLSTTTEYAPDANVEVRGVADVWYSGKNLESVDRLEMDQFGTSEYDETFYASETGSKEIGSIVQYLKDERTESDPLEVTPSTWFDQYERTTQTGTTKDPLTAEVADGGTIDVTIEVQATDLNGNTVIKTIDLSATISVSIQEDGTLTLNAELNNIDVESS